MPRHTARAWTAPTTATADAWSSSTIPTTTSSKSTTSNAGLDLARGHFAQGDFLAAFARCREVLSENAGDVSALLLFARLSLLAGEHDAAVNLLELALQSNPRSETARRLLELLPKSAAYARAVAIDPDIERHTNQFVFAAPVPLAHHVEIALLEARAAVPAFADAHAALGNLYVRTGRINEGIAAYEAAVASEPESAHFRVGLAERLRLFGRPAEASEQLSAGLARSRRFLEPALEGENLRARVLYSADFWEKFVALDLLVDRNAVTLEKLYAPQRASDAQFSPGPDVVFSALTDPHDEDALAWARSVADRMSVPVLNHPSLIARTSRTYLCEAGVVHPALRVPAARRCAKNALQSAADGLVFPLLVRPLRSHRGEGLERLADPLALHNYVRGAEEGDYVVSEFVDYASAGGFFRKYRWIFIDGEPYPHHLAISPEWMVHYFSAPMRQHEWMRAEEAAFLTAPESVFGYVQMEALRALGRTIGLEYFGVDCALVDGSVLVFEANANMLAHDFFGEPEFAYKRGPFNALRAAFDRMLRKERS